MKPAAIHDNENEPPPDMRQTHLHAMFNAVDMMATNDFADYLTADVRFRFGNAPELRGRANVIDAVDAFFLHIAGLSHHVTGCWSHGDTVIVRLEVTYRRLDGDRVSLPCVNVFEYDGGLIKDYRIYMDVAPALPSLT